MFEERVSGKYIMTHIYRDGEEMTPSEVVGLLNHFHQENNYLSAIRENQQQMILNLKEENEQLRQVVEQYRKTNKHLSELCADASKNGYLPPLEDLQ